MDEVITLIRGRLENIDIKRNDSFASLNSDWGSEKAYSC